MSYIYETFSSDTSIRVVTLLPGLIHDNLALHLNIEQLEDCQPFEAISYVWGDATKHEVVTCCDSQLSITQSLAAALRRFRRSTSERRIWADAICINQDDLPERGSQVKLMRRIYEKCSGVLVWLGAEDENTVPALVLVDRIFDEAQAQYTRASIDAGKSENHAAFAEFVELGDLNIAELLPPAESREWLPVKELFSRPWFQRTWVVQEVTASRNVAVFCGNQMIPWLRLGSAALWIQRQLVKDDFNRWRVFEDSNVFEAVTMFDGAYLHEIDFLDCLNLFRGLLATDPRDKVFAMLGLSPFASHLEWLTPDYTKSKLETYKAIVKLSLSYHDNLTILSYVYHEDEITDDLPTWVPRWDRAPAAGRLLSKVPGFDYFASGFDLNRLQYTCRLESRLLTVSGKTLGAVHGVSDLMIAEHFRSIGDLPIETPNAVAKFLRNDLHGFQQYRGNEHAHLMVIRLCYTLTGGLNAEYQLVLTEDEKTDKVDKHFADFSAWLIQYDPQSASYQDMRETFHDGIDYKGDRASYAIAASRVCDDRRLFLFGEDHIGVGPRAMRSGDQLCMLAGGQMLYVLRPKNDCYQFIGECYVDGLMYGPTPPNCREDVKEVQQFRLC